MNNLLLQLLLLRQLRLRSSRTAVAVTLALAGRGLLSRPPP